MADMHGDGLAIAAAVVVLAGSVTVLAVVLAHYIHRGRL